MFTAEEAVTERYRIFYKSEPAGMALGDYDRGGFWLKIVGGGHPNVPGHEDLYQPLMLAYRGGSQIPYVRAAARLYRRLKRAGRLNPYQNFAHIAMGRDRCLTEYELGEWQLQLWRNRWGLYYPRFLNLDDYEKDILEHAVEAYGFLCPDNCRMTFKRWANAIIEQYDSRQAREVARVLMSLYRPPRPQPIGREIKR